MQDPKLIIQQANHQSTMALITIQHHPRFYQFNKLSEPFSCSNCGLGEMEGVWAVFQTSFCLLALALVVRIRRMWASLIKWCSMLKPLASFCCGSFLDGAFLALFSGFLLSKLSLAGWRRASRA